MCDWWEFGFGYAALRGAATLKARALKEVWNIAAVTPLERGVPLGICGKGGHNTNNSNTSTSDSGEIVNVDNFLGICSQELLARGTELLKRTRKGCYTNFWFTAPNQLKCVNHDM